MNSQLKSEKEDMITSANMAWTVGRIPEYTDKIYVDNPNKEKGHKNNMLTKHCDHHLEKGHKTHMLTNNCDDHTEKGHKTHMLRKLCNQNTEEGHKNKQNAQTALKKLDNG